MSTSMQTPQTMAVKPNGPKMGFSKMKNLSWVLVAAVMAIMLILAVYATAVSWELRKTNNIDGEKEKHSKLIGTSKTISVMLTITSILCVGMATFYAYLSFKSDAEPNSETSSTEGVAQK